jgi:putative ABC transport system permease protein
MGTIFACTERLPLGSEPSATEMARGARTSTLPEDPRMQTLLRDLSFGARMLVRQRLFTIVAVSMLALGIGANTAIFSVVNTVLLRAFPYRDVDRLVVLAARGASDSPESLRPTELERFQNRMQTLEGLAMETTQSVNLTGGERPARVRGAFVSANFFDVFGVTPRVGRSFEAGEDRPGAERVAIVSERLWHERLNADPALLHARLTFNGEPHRIIGVAPTHFVHPFEPEPIDVWSPLSNHPSPDAPAYYGMGYLKEGRVLSEAQAEAATVMAELAASNPPAYAGRSARFEFYREAIAARSRPLLLSLFAAVAVILLIACTNLAHLLLARGLERRREFSIRAALGASRWQLVRQLMTEATLLGLAGGTLGFVVAHWGLAALLSIPQNFVPIEDVALDGRVLLFTLALSLLTASLFGLLPALQLSKPELGSVLKEGARGSGEGARWNRIRDGFVVVQVALSLLLLVGATLLFRSFDGLLQVDLGFEPRGLLTMEYRLPRNKYPERAAQAEIHRRIIEEVRAVPGVETGALVIGLPFSGNDGPLEAVQFPDRAPAPPGKEVKVMIQMVTPSYFETLGIKLIQGRHFDDRDRLDTPAVLIINATMARTFWPDQSAVGKSVTLVDGSTTATVVGVVGDARHRQREEQPTPLAYAPFAQRPDPFAALAVRTALEPLSLIEPVRQAIWKADSDQPMWKIRTLESLVEGSLADRKFLVTLVGIFAALALLLTWIGLYGAIRYVVDRRTPEIGIRMALGAQARDVVRLLSRQGMKLVALGLGLGLGAAWLMTRFIASFLYGVSATDAPTFLVIAASLVPITWLACYLPARRATSIDPMLALRHE